MIYERAITLLSGRYGGRAAPQAYLEFAQEHFLAWMATEGLFAGGHPLIFKGGTALRKFRFGLAGRFSTDLDVAAESTDYPEHVLDSLEEGSSFEGVTFHLTDFDRPALKGTWRAQAEGIAGETIDAKLDFSPRPTLYPPVSLLPRPAADWRVPYARMALEVGLAAELDRGYELAAGLLDPLLSGYLGSAFWESAAQKWATPPSQAGD